jgi:hypothetical protein
VTSKKQAEFRKGELLRVRRGTVAYGRNAVTQSGSLFTLQHRLFLNDPWELIAEAIARELPDGKMRDVTQSFRRQAEDYFRAATVARELAVRPVLLYYAFLNLAKAYAIVEGKPDLTERAYHGILSFSPSSGTAIPGLDVNFDNKKKQSVFKELLSQLGGNAAMLNTGMKLGHLMPQILPGHRLWCYATNKTERFLTITKSRLLHSEDSKEVWLNLYVHRDELGEVGLSEEQVLINGDLHEFEIAADPDHVSAVCFQQKSPVKYDTDPLVSVHKIISATKNKIWETVRVESPYRRLYVYCCPPQEHGARLPQMLSVYLLMFCLSSVTRYSPGYFDYLLDSRYGPVFATFISESPMQFLYLMASDILGREVSKPAII